MRIALVEPFAGVAGDMFVAALIDAGAPFGPLRAMAERLGPVGISHRRTKRAGLHARRFFVRQSAPQRHRGLKQVLRVVERARLPARARERARAAFEALADAEAGVHGIGREQVHFHEVGALDALCDVCAAALALELLEVERLFCRALPLSTGSVQASHGELPVPAPATLALLRGRTVRESGLEGELVTPTGAALVAAWCEPGPPPEFVPRSIGYGAGARDPETYPNVCRIVVGDRAGGAGGGLFELVCDVDDATPQVLGHLLARLIESGALDATLQPLVMKKNRPGTRVCALARLEQVPALEHLLFAEGTTLGVRRRAVERTELARRSVIVETGHGRVRVKLGLLGGRAVHVAPEYEDCREVARRSGRPLREIVRLALERWDA